MRKYLCLGICICIIALLINPLAARSADRFPSTVKVGLYYESSARSLYQITSDDGIKVMKNDGQEEFTVMTFSDKLLKVSTASLDGFSSLKNNIRDRQEALEYASKYENQGAEIFLLYDGSWSVLAKRGSGEFLSTGTYLAIKGDSTTPGLLLPFKQQAVFFMSQSPDGLIAIEGRRYRGMLKMTPAGGGNIQVVNELGIEEYLYGVVPLEITSSWHEEALKAQAVAARTYTIANLSKWAKYGFDVSANTGDQLYGGYDVENLRTNKAVDETAGQVILYNGEPITAFYHADSGGRTEACSDVFSAELPYLQPVEDLIYANSPHSEWQVILSKKDISDRLSSSGQNIGEIRQISVVERSQAGRVTKLLLKGSLGEVLLEKSQIRTVLGLKSNFFDLLGENNSLSAVVASGENLKRDMQLEGKSIITANGQALFFSKEAFILADGTSKVLRAQGSKDVYTFLGRGYGHGVGLSQWGAKAMAENGYNYVDILLHYYRNTQVENMSEFKSNKIHF